MADSNLMQIAYGLEGVAWGTASTATYQPVAINSETISRNTTSVRSALMRADRQKANSVLTGFDVQGNIVADLMADAWDDWWGWVMQSAGTGTKTTASPADATFASGDNSVNGSATLPVVAAGDWVLISGATEAGNNGLFRVGAGPTTSKIVFDRGTVTADASPDTITIAEGIYWNNGATPPLGITVEKFIDFATGTDVYHAAVGIWLRGASISAGTGNIATVTWDVLGKTLTQSTSSSRGGTGTVVNNTVFNTIDGTSVFIGSAKSTITQSLDISIANGLSSRGVIGVQGPHSLVNGSIDVSGSFTGIFDASDTEFAKFLANTSTSFAVAFSDGANGLVIEMPSVRYTSAQVTAQGQDQDAPLTAEWAADIGSDDYTVRIWSI